MRFAGGLLKELNLVFRGVRQKNKNKDVKTG
jgi:hypothetical protein